VYKVVLVSDSGSSIVVLVSSSSIVVIVVVVVGEAVVVGVVVVRVGENGVEERVGYRVVGVVSSRSGVGGV